jgi:type II secretory pathway pseudopilin PulG
VPVTGRPRRRASAGFTLVELMISMSLVVIVGVVIVQVMLSQSRVVQQTTEQVRVREALRRGMDLMSADLRGVSPPQGDIVSFTSTSLSVLATIGSGIVCGVNPSSSAPTSIDLVPENAAKAGMTYFSDPPVAGDSTELLTLSNGTWQAVAITAVSTSTSACSGSVFLSAPADNARIRYRLAGAFPPNVVNPGDVVRIVRQIRYLLTQQGSGTWHLTRGEDRRSNRSSAIAENQWTNTVVAGPFRSGTGTPAGLRVQLFDEAGNELTSATRAQADRVALVFRGLGHATSAPSGVFAGAVADSLVLSVLLRNR